MHLGIIVYSVLRGNYVDALPRYRPLTTQHSMDRIPEVSLVSPATHDNSKSLTIIGTSFPDFQGDTIVVDKAVPTCVRSIQSDLPAVVLYASLPY